MVAQNSHGVIWRRSGIRRCAPRLIGRPAQGPSPAAGV